MIVGLLLALGAALTTGVASVLQGLAARQAAEEPADSLADGSIRQARGLPALPCGGRTRRCRLRLHRGGVALAAVVPRAMCGRVERGCHSFGRTTGAWHRAAATQPRCVGRAGPWTGATRLWGDRAGSDGRVAVGAVVVGHRVCTGGRGRRDRVAMGSRPLECPRGRHPSRDFRRQFRRHRGRVADSL